MWYTAVRYSVRLEWHLLGFLRGSRHATEAALPFLPRGILLMAMGGFFALLDDITSLLDDIAAITKVAAGKTSAIVGDDLALNAKQLVNVEAHRELSVVYTVAKGSLINKAILIPAALLMSAFAPFLLLPLLMIGGAFLCYEGVEKVIHAWQHRPHSTERDSSITSVAGETEDEKIRSAIRTDFILSAEIIAIALGSSSEAPLIAQAISLVAIGMIMTVVVYGLVAAIVKADDLGLFLAQRDTAHPLQRIYKGIGVAILRGTPLFMRTISFLGTLAMFTVGGGIVAHGIPSLHHGIERGIARMAELLPAYSVVVAPICGILSAVVVGLIVGYGVVVAIGLVRRLARR